jgi:hypothetical protein
MLRRMMLRLLLELLPCVAGAAAAASRGTSVTPYPALLRAAGWFLASELPAQRKAHFKHERGADRQAADKGQLGKSARQAEASAVQQRARYYSLPPRVLVTQCETGSAKQVRTRSLQSRARPT